MFNVIKSAYILHYKSSLKKAIFAIFIFVIVHIFSNIEIIRENAEDFSFDIVNKFFISSFKENTNSPKVKLFAVDEQYLKSENLLTKHSEINYGYTFPRDKIALFIEELDKHIDNLEDNIPKVLFIDYDMTYRTTNYNSEYSDEDNRLLEVLKRPRKYKIILPKTNYQNIIEDSKDHEIKKLIKDGNIILVSVGLTVSDDDVSRRYFPYKQFNNKEYLNAPITIFNLFNDNSIKTNDLKQQNVIENRILFKTYNDLSTNKQYKYNLSNWTNLSKYSANYPLHLIINEEFKDSIIIFGSSYKNHDIFKNSSTIGNINLNGVDIHANTVMTLFWLNGPLNKINILIGIILVFLIFFLMDVLIEIIFEIGNLQNYNFSEFLVLLIFSALFLILISNYILTNYQLWFNWIVPFIIFQLIELIELLKLKTIIKKLKEKGKK